MPNRRKFIAGFGTLAVGTLAGCSGDDEDTETPVDTDTPTETETPTDTDTDTPTGTETPTDTDTDTTTDTDTDTTTDTPTDTPPTEQTAKLSASDGDSEDVFGASVAVSGDGSTALVGARGDEDPNGAQAGSAYVFSRSNGAWTEETKLSASDGDSEDRFGWSVAVSDDGSTALVGAPFDEDPNGTQAGSAYVFSRSGGSWTEEAKLTAIGGDSEDRFGWSVAVSGDGSIALVGAWGDEDPNGNAAGSAYVFSRADGSWSEEEKLIASDGDSNDLFGYSVSVSEDGSRALIGTSGDEDPNGDRAGSAYVFSRSGGSWTEETKLSASDGDSEDNFGYSVAVSRDGSTGLVGAPQIEKSNDAGGSAYVFSETDDGGIKETLLLASDGDSEDRFGNSVALGDDGSTALVGAQDDENPIGSGAGSSYVFSRSGDTWTEEAKLTASDGDSEDVFGWSVAVSGDESTALVGALTDEDPNGAQAGSAYVFE